MPAVHRARVPLVAAVACVAAFHPAVANDSTAVLEAGGIRLTIDAGVKMQSEDLRISAEQISVDYVFTTDFTEGVTTLVAFPLPEYDLAIDGPQLLDGPNDSVGDRIGFRVWVDGREIAPQIEAKALRNGVDVTGLIEAAGIPPATLDYDRITQALAHLSPELKQQFVARDLAYFYDGYDAAPEPKWTIKLTYWWTQTFTSAKPVHVRHEYRPVVGMFFLSKAEPPELDPKQFCMGPGEVAGVAKRAHPPEGYALASEVKYILTTGGNWEGNIGTFRLTVDKGAPENQISLCFDGLKKTGPTTFEATRTDWVPGAELDILIVSPPGN